jgi:hypothetical protein
MVARVSQHCWARVRAGGGTAARIVSILGALAVPGAYVANQLRRIGPSQLSYAVANFAGAAILTAVAVVDR